VCAARVPLYAYCSPKFNKAAWHLNCFYFRWVIVEFPARSNLGENTMRNFILVCVVALLVAAGVAYAVGFIDFTYEHRDGKCLVSNIINTSMLRHEGSSRGATPASAPADDNTLDVKGKVTAVRPEKNELTVSENVKSWTFELTKGARVTINDRDSKLS